MPETAEMSPPQQGCLLHQGHCISNSKLESYIRGGKKQKEHQKIKGWLQQQKRYILEK
jgi:hypothetical protein